MWLLPVLSSLCRVTARTFYQLTFAGNPVPAHGPVLLVGNHPNALLDPALLAAAARRPVRFLAKAPLFEPPQLGWLMRAAGCIPVYRRQDDPSLVGQNADTFRAVEEAMVAGAAVGLFPEGVSHDEPALAPLKTGAARIALGTAARLGRSIPIIPVGVVLRDKAIFRSEALVVVGAPVAWDDLAHSSADDIAAIRELTRRIERALRRVTVNLEQWEDRPIVETAESIYAAEFDGDADHARRVERLQLTADLLARLRREGDVRWRDLANDIARHGRRLRWLGLRPADLKGKPGLGAVVRWGLRTGPAASLPAVVVAAVGIFLFWLPYRLTGVIAERASPGPGTHATYKALYGFIVFGLWTLLLTGSAVVVGGWMAGVGAFVTLPVIGLITLAVSERWRASREDARRFFILRGERVDQLRRDQRVLAVRIQAILQDTIARPPAPPASA